MMNSPMSVSRSAGLRRPSLDPFISVLPTRQPKNFISVRSSRDGVETGTTAIYTEKDIWLQPLRKDWKRTLNR